MNTEYSKQFAKAAKLLSRKYQNSLKSIIRDVKEANSISEIKNCRKIIGAENTHRIRMGRYRIVFVIIITNNTAFFKLLLPRGDVYKGF